MPLGMSEEDIARLVDMGQLEKSFLDRVYLDTKQDEFETDVEPVARGLAQKIATDPQTAAIAKRTEELVKGDTSPAPAPLPTPNPAIEGRTITATTTDRAAPQTVVRTGNPASIPPAGDPDSAVMAQVKALSDASHSAESGEKEDTLANIEKAFRLQQMGIMAEADATARGNAQIAALNTDLAKRLGQEADSAKAQRQKTEIDRDAQIAKLKKMDDEFSKMTIDPNRFWATRTTEQKIWAAIGIGLSAYGAKAGGGNKALEVINSAIDKDIDMQKAQIELKKQQIGVSRSVLSDMLDVLKDKDAAENMAKSAMIQQVNLQIATSTARTNSEIAKANGMKLMGELEQKRQEYLSKALSNDALDRQVAANAALESGRDVPLIQSTKDISRYLTKDSIRAQIPGVGWAHDATTRKDVIDKKSAVDSINANIDRLIQLRKKVGIEVNPFSAERAQANVLRQDILMKIKQAEALGALDAGVDRATAPIAIQDPLGASKVDWATLGVGREIFGDPLIAGLEQYKKQIKAEFYGKIKSQLAGVLPSFAKEMDANDIGKTTSLKEAGTKVE